MRSRIAAAVVLLAYSSLAVARSQSQKERGAAIFKESGCQHCHAIGGVGGHKGPDLSGVGRRRSKAAMRERIVSGSKVMPAFGEMIGPEELSDIIAYLRSCRAKPVKSAPASKSN